MSAARRGAGSKLAAIELDDVQPRYRAALDGGDLEPARAWEQFKALAAEPVAGLDPEYEMDLVLFETSGEDPFALDLARRISVYEDDDDPVDTLAVNLRLLFDAQAGLEHVRLWGCGGSVAPGVGARPRLDAWIAEVEATPALRLLRAGRANASSLSFGSD